MPLEKIPSPTCVSLTQQIDRWFRVLGTCGVDVPNSAEYCFQRCSECRSKGTTKKKRCRGGNLKIDTNNAIRFTSMHGNLPIRATVTAATQWSDSSSPFPKRHSVEVEVSSEGRLSYRAHLDLATDSSREPLFHLQAGGFRVDKKVEEKHFHFLRWPTIPLDLVLVTELILYTFQPEIWEKVHRNSEFLQAVKTSEEQFLAPFFRLGSNPRDHSFLAAFCSFR
jgi:hypothetical protein